MGLAVVTVSVLKPETAPEVAEMAVWPAEALLARPVDVIGATVALEEFQVATLVTSCTVPSVKVPLAAKC